ncbi:conjugal transfer pilin signal peptidase TrbI [Sphingomonas zeicaulis]|uniref:S26 family signal peptidase n=1 Tax=Sphingomonas zeicaulis TaxID=1632740 RepID=UPI003D198C9E
MAAAIEIPSSTAEAQSWRPRKRLWALLLFVAAVFAVLGGIRQWRNDHLFLINATDSLPNWAFVINRHEAPARGRYIFFDPPHVPLVISHFGPRPKMFGKIVYGMPGDIVAHRGADVIVAGKRVARMKPLTRKGETLTPGATGTIPQGCYYVGTPHKDGFDSRYAEIGFVCRRQVIGVGVPVL